LRNAPDTRWSGLASYGPNQIDQYKRAAGYVDRIVKGEKPADLPVQAPTKYELVVNLKTAKALGFEIGYRACPRRRGDRVKRREFNKLVGDVTVASEPGKGSVFTVRLPSSAKT